MYFYYALAAAFFYALQNTLMAGIYRRMDPLSALGYRGFALAVTMFPLLFFVPSEIFKETTTVLPYIILAAFVAMIGATYAANAIATLIVGFAALFTNCAIALSGMTVDTLYYHSPPKVVQVLLVCLLFVSMFRLIFCESSENLVHHGSLWRGVFDASIGGVFILLAYVIVGEMSQRSHPYLVGYIWEFFIGFWCMVVAVVRGLRGNGGVASVTKGEFLRILLYSSPTVFGTAAYLTALSTGPLSIVTALLSLVMVMSFLFAWFLYREHITGVQCLYVGIIGFIIFVLKLASG